MPRKIRKQDADRIRKKHQKEEEQKAPLLIFISTDEESVRQNEFDSAGPVHRSLMEKVGKLAWLSYNICNLNGRSQEFNRMIVNAKFLLIHGKEKLRTEKLKTLNHQIKHLKKANPRLKIFSTMDLPEAIKISTVNEITKYLKP
ncbi:MAG TPA: hypothetical protein PLA05_02185 [bacterium]|jgi:hypothetical protein|nr:hypothetical protein [bacterium]HPW05752.1 hypothetical protein [bacterium]HPY99468.1 hypothetical protein [bacterium]HQB76345.1 hypothetical protein [bacterium]